MREDRRELHRVLRWLSGAVGPVRCRWGRGRQVTRTAIAIPGWTRYERLPRFYFSGAVILSPPVQASRVDDVVAEHRRGQADELMCCAPFLEVVRATVRVERLTPG